MEPESKFIEILERINKEEDKYFLGSYNGRLILSRIIINDIAKTPLNITRCLEKMANIFTAKLMKLNIYQPEWIEKKCFKFIMALKKVIPNIVIGQKAFLAQLTSIFSEMRDKIDKELNNLLCILIKNLKEVCNMPATARKLFFTITLESKEQEFYLKMLTSQTDPTEIIKDKIFRIFNLFIADKDAAEREIDKFNARYLELYSEIRTHYGMLLLETSKTSYHSLELEQVCIFTSELSLNIGSIIKDFKPNWNPMLCSITQKDRYEISQISEIKNGFLLALKLYTSNRSFIFACINQVSSLAMVLNTENILITSGTILDYFYICQTYPKKLLKCTIDKEKIIILDDINISMDTYTIFVSITCISNTESLLFITNIGDILIKTNNEENLFIPFSNIWSRVYIWIKFLEKNDVLALKTEEFLYFYNLNFELIHEYQCYAKDVALYEDNYNIVICC